MSKLKFFFLFILFFSFSLKGLEFNQNTKTEIFQTSNDCFVWKNQKDLLLEKTFNFNNRYEITTFLCGEKDEAFGWLSPDGPDAKEIISTNGVDNKNDCINPFFGWEYLKDKSSYKFFYIKDLIKNQELFVCSYGKKDGYFVIDQEIVESEKFLEIKFKGGFHEYHIYLLENLSAKPVIFNYSKSSYTLKTKNGVIELQGGEEYNLSEILEEHFNIQLEDKNITFVPWI